MKRSGLFTLLLLCRVAHAEPVDINSAVKISYDNAKNVSIVGTDSIRIGKIRMTRASGLQWASAFYSYSGTEPKRPDSGILWKCDILSFKRPEWNHVSSISFKFGAETQIYKVSKYEVEPVSDVDFALESVYATMPTEQYEAMMKSDSIAIQIDKQSFTLADNRIVPFKNLRETIPGK